MEPFSRDTRSVLDPDSPYSLSSEYGSYPPEVEITSGQEQRAVVKEPKSPYNQARAYIESFNHHHRYELPSHEEPFAIKIPLKEWFKLENDFDLFETDQIYPRYSYNASTSTLTIETMAPPLHGSVTNIFSQGFFVAKARLTRDMRLDMKISHNEKYNDFDGQYIGSTKTSNLLVEFRNAAGKLEPKFAVEVGFSEEYEDLVEDVKLWLEGTHSVSVAVLVKIYETPKYKQPHLDDEEIKKLSDITKIRNEPFIFEGEYGPVKLRGLTWVGCISEAFMEVWRRDPATGSAFQDGDSLELFQTPAYLSQLQFRLSEFLAVDPQMDQTIPFQWGHFKPILKDEIERLAETRCRDAVKDLQKAADPDYEPSQDN